MRTALLSLLVFLSSATVLTAGELLPVGADGAPTDGAGNPWAATFSLCALDPETGEIGVAVTTRVPFVGRAVPWTRAGVGAVATQAWTIVEYGERGLDLLEGGASPEVVLETLLADDAGRELRQLGVLAADGRTASFTGKETSHWAGARSGEGFTVQGNLLAGAEVVESVARHFEESAGLGMPLAERMILAMRAGQEAGGDRRKGNLQSAAIRISDPNDPGRGGDHLSLAIEVGEHPHPLEELERIYRTTARRLGYRAFSEVRGPDVVELKRALQVLGYWRPDGEEIPEAPVFPVRRELSRENPEAFEVSIESWRMATRTWSDAWSVYDRETMEAVDAFRKAEGIDHPGLPSGRVDAELVAALRAARARITPSRDGNGR